MDVTIIAAIIGALGATIAALIHTMLKSRSESQRNSTGSKDNTTEGAESGYASKHTTSVPIQSPSQYTDGDWITAAIVGPDHVEVKLKELATEFTGLETTSRAAKLDQIVKRVQSVIGQLSEKHAEGGNTVETRLDACIAKVVAHILQRELTNFQWNAGKRLNDDPITIFRDTDEAFVESESNKGKDKKK